MCGMIDTRTLQFMLQVTGTLKLTLGCKIDVYGAHSTFMIILSNFSVVLQVRYTCSA